MGEAITHVAQANFHLEAFFRVVASGMILTLPDIPDLPAADLRLELACGLYASRKLARGRAADVAGIDENQFEKELQSRGITNGYSTDDLDADLAALNELLAR